MKASFERYVHGLLLLSVLPVHLSAQQPESTTARLSARANLVVVNVSVTDRAGKPLHGLKQQDFSVREAGQAQQINNFEEHKSVPVSQLQTEPSVKLPPGYFTNYTAVPPTAALDVLLVDRLNTPTDAQADLLRQLDDYLAKAPANHQVAIFGLNSRLSLLQGFSGNPTALREALKRAGPENSVALGNPSSNLPDQHLSDAKSSDGSPDGQYAGTSAPDMLEGNQLATFEARVALFETETRIRMTLAALESLAEYLTAMPGRKNVIWFTGSFPTYFAPNGGLSDTFASSGDAGRLLHDTLNKLAKAQVAIFPVDARGLMTVPQYDPAARGNEDPQQFSQQLAAFNDKTAGEHITMEQTARETGGAAFFNTNGLKEAAAKIINTGDDYYTLTYSPTDPPKNDIFHSIDVALTGQVATLKPVLAYRRGYYGGANEKQSGFENLNVETGKPAPSPILSMLSHGIPDASQILLKVHVAPAVAASAPPEDDPSSATHVADGVKGPWRRYVVDVAVPPSQVLGAVDNGDAPANLEMLLLCFDNDGKPMSSASGNVALHVPKANLLKLQQEGLRLRQVISVPARKRLFLRVGVHNLLDNGLGSVEIPLDAVNDLPPAL